MIDDDDYELASAYCDGDLDAVQRARVEADPALLVVVDEITLLRSQLGDHAASALDAASAPDQRRAAPADVKASQLAFAGDAFSELFAAEETSQSPIVAATTPAAPVIDLRSRKRYRMLTMAAGFVIVAGVGIMAINSLNGSSGDASSSEATSAEVEAGSDVPAAALQSDSTDSADSAATEEATTEAAETDTTEAAADSAATSTEAPDQAKVPRLAPLDQPEPLYTFDPEDALIDIVATIDEDREARLAEGSTETYQNDFDSGPSCASVAFPDDAIEYAILVARGDQFVELAIVGSPTTTFAVTFTAGCVESERVDLPDRG